MNVVEEIHFHMESDDDANIFSFSFCLMVAAKTHCCFFKNKKVKDKF